MKMKNNIYQDSLGTKCLLAVIILIILLWFISIALIGKGNSLELFSKVTHTDRNKSVLDKFWIRNDYYVLNNLNDESKYTDKITLLSKDKYSTKGRISFRHRTLSSIVSNYHKSLLTFLSFLLSKHKTKNTHTTNKMDC